MKFPYAAHYQPPFPVLELRLHNEEQSRHTDLLAALIDTGADGTLIPISYLRQMLAPALTTQRLRSHWGEWRAVQQFAIDIEIAGRRLANVFVVGDEQGDEIVLGRNVLNRLRLFLDGVANETELQ